MIRMQPIKTFVVTFEDNSTTKVATSDKARAVRLGADKARSFAGPAPDVNKGEKIGPYMNKLLVKSVDEVE